MNYLTSDFVIRIKNAAMARRRSLYLPYSKLNLEIGKVLKAEGFLSEIKESQLDGKKALHAVITYTGTTPVLSDVEIVSKPSLRVYAESKKIPDIMRRARQKVILSTNQGILTGEQAYKKNVGGEVLFKIW